MELIGRWTFKCLVNMVYSALNVQSTFNCIQYRPLKNDFNQKIVNSCKSSTICVVVVKILILANRKHCFKRNEHAATGFGNLL